MKCIAVKRIAFALALMLLCGSSQAFAAPRAAEQPNVYRDTVEEARFHMLASSLRCVMCQNESLADSDAPIAHDLRRAILVQMRKGKSDVQIRDYLVARFGEFVLYKPPIEPATWLLWFGPLAFLACGGVTVAFIVRRRAMGLQTQPSTPDVPVESSEDW